MSLEVLAVDDSRTMRDMLNLALSSAGFTTHLAEDGVHGLEVLEGIKPDVIITDINMPRMDGFGFMDAVRSEEKWSRIPQPKAPMGPNQNPAPQAQQAGLSNRLIPQSWSKPFKWFLDKRSHYYVRSYGRNSRFVLY